ETPGKAGKFPRHLLHHSPHPPPTTCYTTCGEASQQAGSCPEAKIARVYAKPLAASRQIIRCAKSASQQCPASLHTRPLSTLDCLAAQFIPANLERLEFQNWRSRTLCLGIRTNFLRFS